MVSEDSDQLRPGFPTVHRLDDANDLQKTLSSPMDTAIDEIDTCRELCEVFILRGSQRMPLEKRNHRLQQIHAPSYHVTVQVLAMIVCSTIHDHLTDSEVPLELVQGANAPRTLCDHELMEHLESGSADYSPLPA